MVSEPELIRRLYRSRGQSGERTDLRFVPELTFVPDRSAERAVRIAGLLREARERKSG